ncbi:MAG: quercetin 2,3-dioxygenase [Cyclobacteriaceae bacterium]|nr:MAG: quercetin 2,3-dioxygenase [Cyclobacteriaceae bacterium]
MRTIKQIIDTQDVMMGDIKVGQPLPTENVRQISPFLLLHHLGPIEISPGENPMDIGPHPHRGFAPVTFVFEGHVAHTDSLGNQRVVSKGGVQWMSAGRGIVHAESVGQELIDSGGSYEIIQLWINLPGNLKMSEPSYQPFDAAEIPYFEDQEKRVRLNVICGQYKNIQGPVKHPTEVLAYTLFMEAGSSITIPGNTEWNFIVYQLSGDTKVNNGQLNGRQLAYFNFDGTEVRLEARKASRYLIVSGPVINEPLAQYGPFVMNRPEELQQAINDYQAGEMGVL